MASSLKANLGYYGAPIFTIFFGVFVFKLLGLI